MSFKSFLKLVEIQTKLASIIPYFLATVFVVYRYRSFHWQQAILFFAGMFLFDMTVTAINNYMDFKRAVTKSGFGYEQHNAISRDGLKLSTVRLVIGTMLTAAAVLGLLLVWQTDFIVLLLGMLCFAIGFIYSVGPIPISGTPFGEVLSGMTQGFLLPFLTAYIHLYDKGLVQLLFSDQEVSVTVNWRFALEIFIVGIPAITGIANIMLANNTCDMEEDITNKRHTLPFYIGKENALMLFQGIYYAGYAGILVAVVLGILPFTALAAMATLPEVQKNIKAFRKVQLKGRTFGLSVKNFIMINGVYILGILAGAVIDYI